MGVPEEAEVFVANVGLSTFLDGISIPQTKSRFKLIDNRLGLVTNRHDIHHPTSVSHSKDRQLRVASGLPHVGREQIQSIYNT